jgi:hypothetical protein
VQPGVEARQVLLPVPGQLEAVRHGDLLVQHAQVEDLVDPVGARTRRRHQVPPAGLQHQPVRLQPPVDVGRLLPAPVADLQHPAVPDRAGHHGQQRYLLGRLVPARRVQVEPGLHPPDLLAQAGRQGGQQLELRRGQHRAEPELGRGPGQPGQRQRLGLGGAQPGQPRTVAVDELVAAAVPGVAVQRDAGLVQGLHVPVDGTDRDLELPGQLRGRHPAPGLEQEQDRDQPAGAHGADSAAFH